MWCYVIIWGGPATRERVAKALKNHGVISKWLSYSSDSMFVTSPYGASTLKDALRVELPAIRFFVVDTQSDHAGWMPRAAWNLVNSPEE